MAELKTPEQIAQDVMDAVFDPEGEGVIDVTEATDDQVYRAIVSAIEADRAQRTLPAPNPADERLVRDDLDRFVVRSLEGPGALDLSDGMVDLTINTDKLIRLVQNIVRGWADRAQRDVTERLRERTEIHSYAFHSDGEPCLRAMSTADCPLSHAYGKTWALASDRPEPARVCKHCGKPVKPAINPEGEPDWKHTNGRWGCYRPGPKTFAEV